MREQRTSGLLRRGLALAIDALFAAMVLGLGYATGLLDSAPFRPDPGWFWTEWWLRIWLDDTSVFVVPAMAFFVLVWLWTLGWEFAASRTPGDRLLQIEVVDSDGMRPAWYRLLIRGLAVWVNIATLGLGWLLGFVSPSRRAFHDLVSGTWVVRTR